MSGIESLDPRVNRLNIEYDRSDYKHLEPMDELETYECFVQLKEGKPFLHVGVVHAPNQDIAFTTGKEQYSRRLTCSGFWVVESKYVTRGDYANVNCSVFDLIDANPDVTGNTSYEVFYQPKRGVQHKYAGAVKAGNVKEAFSQAKLHFSDKKAVNLWVIPSENIRKSTPEEVEIWNMLPDKAYREAFVYKVKDRINRFKEQQKVS